MWHVHHYRSIDGLASCFVVNGQLLADNGRWTGRVLFHRYESPASSECVSRVKEFPPHPTQESLMLEIEGWIKRSLFERWTVGELHELEPAAILASSAK